MTASPVDRFGGLMVQEAVVSFRSFSDAQVRDQERFFDQNLRTLGVVVHTGGEPVDGR